jgi:2-polyprenyl-3-methyl-5-hydroxy-6-metoxy-1,4-benzoquinol methylase
MPTASSTQDQSLWSRFWRESGGQFDDVMEISTLAAARRLDHYYKFRASDSILDFGCGPAYLVKYLLFKNVKVTGADISKEVIKQNRTRYPGAEFVFIEDVTSVQDTLQNAIGEKRFDYVILLSVVQYFEDIARVSAVIAKLQKVLKPGGRLIVADVVNSKTSRLSDAAAAFFECFRKGRGMAFLRFIIRLLTSQYSSVARSQPLLVIDDPGIDSVASANGMRWKKLPQMSVHPSRASYELRLP